MVLKNQLLASPFLHFFWRMFQIMVANKHQIFAFCVLKNVSSQPFFGPFFFEKGPLPPRDSDRQEVQTGIAHHHWDIPKGMIQYGMGQPIMFLGQCHLGPVGQAQMG
jgi:hypothetical protein